MRAERKLSRFTFTAIAVFVLFLVAYSAFADEASYYRVYSDCQMDGGTEVGVEIEMLTSTKDIPSVEEFRDYIQRICATYTYDEADKLILHLHTFTAGRLQLPRGSIITNVAVSK